MDVLLVAGLWLDASAWDDVAPELERLGHRARPVALPGQGDGAADATFDDQVAAVLAEVDGAGDRVHVVGHSAAATLAWVAADRRPDRVSGVSLIGGFPEGDGGTYADFFEIRDGFMAFPGWEPFEGPDAVDLDSGLRERIAARAQPVPAGVARGVVHLLDERRFQVPVTLICPEFTPRQAREWIAAGELPELARAARLDLVDLDSGHWPMFTRPAELARLIAAAATS